jgi:V8-like Glu-specific endopeptidase
MLRFLLFIILSSSLFAAPPIEGGKDAPLSSFEYVDIIKITRADQGECTATRVSPILILTAAHCIKGMVVGSSLRGAGKIVKVTIHPKYAEAKAAKKKELTTLYDIAFIEVEARPSQRTMEYPSIISSKTKLGTRKKMDMAGYGSNEAKWNGTDFDYLDTKFNMQLASNEWEACPLNYFGNEVTALDTFNTNIKEHLSVKAKRVHTIVKGQESLVYDGKGMILPGDSGSPSLERDENNKLVVTGVASNIVAFQDGSGEASLNIEVDGKVITKKLDALPENWGQRTKSDLEFDEIKNMLKEQNLLTESGEPKPGVVIKRQYTRVTEGNYSDLSHPENQKFIKAMMP